MEFINFIESLEELSKKLGLPKPLEINQDLEVSLVVNSSTPLVIRMRYDRENKKVIISSPLSYIFPESREEIHSLMNKLFQDLIIRDKTLGRLSAGKDDPSLHFIQEIGAEEKKAYSLAEFVPLFIEEVLSWREKILKGLNESSPLSSCLKEEELLSFNFQI